MPKTTTMPTLLNVGAGNRLKEFPPHYAGWKHLRLDIDPDCGADVVCDARLLCERFPPASYDAIYCSHNLEHYYPHDGERVLRGFAHVLKPDGFAEIRVPDLEDELYASPAPEVIATRLALRTSRLAPIDTSPIDSLQRR